MWVIGLLGNKKNLGINHGVIFYNLIFLNDMGLKLLLE